MLTLGDLEELCLFLHVRHSLLLCLREVVGFDERPVLERLVRLEVLVVGLVLRGGHWATASRDWAEGVSRERVAPGGRSLLHTGGGFFCCCRVWGAHRAEEVFVGVGGHVDGLPVYGPGRVHA